MINAAAGGIANGIKVGIQLLMLPLMAHLLGPAEFGLYALALPTVALFTSLADGGLGISLARESDTSSALWSTAFWVLLMSGICLAVMVSGWGLILSVLSHEPRLKGMMGLMSCSVLMISMSILPTARLTRQNRLVVFAASDLAATIVGATLAIGVAASGGGAWGLAAQYIAGYSTRAVILNLVAFVPPTWEFQLATLKDHVSTGGAVLGARVVDFSGRLLENLVYQRAFGAAGLGTYTFANQAPRFLCEAVSNPIWGALYAHALHEEPRQIGIVHAKLVQLLAAVVFPTAFLVSAAAPELVNLVLGPRWSDAALLLRILVPFHALYVIASQSGAILLATGRSWRLFWCTTSLVVARVAAVSLGFTASPEIVAYAVGASYVLFTALMLVMSSKATEQNLRQLLGMISGPFVAAALVGGMCAALLSFDTVSVVWLAASLLMSGLTYLLIMWWVNGRQLLAEFRMLRAKRAEAP